MRNLRLILKTIQSPWLVAITVFLFAVQVAAQEPQFTYVPQRTAAQKTLLKNLKAKKHKAALQAWSSALGQERFNKTYTGKALQAYLMFESGMPVLALENLMSLKRPRHIEGEVRQLWRTSATAQHPAWQVAHVKWHKKWTQVFPTSVRASIESHPVFSLRNKSQLKVIIKKLKEAPNGSTRKAALQWQLAQWAPVYNKEDIALNVLMDLAESEQKLVSKDEIYLTMGRVLYQRGDLNEAIQVYDKVSKGSDYWLEALEEKAWAYLRLKKPGKALGELESVMTPIFFSQVGPEPYFLSSLINLKICDFPQVFKNSKAFKDKFKTRVQTIQALAKGKSSPAAAQAVNDIVNKGFSLKVISPYLASLPRLFQRDEFLKRHLTYARTLRQESQLAQKLMSGDPDLKNLMSQADKVVAAAKKAAGERIQVMAKAEAEEFSEMIRKLHLVEAEVIQRIHRSFELTKGSEDEVKDANTLVFPKDKESQEVWLDEIGHYQVNAKECLDKEGRTL